MIALSEDHPEVLVLNSYLVEMYVLGLNTGDFRSCLYEIPDVSGAVWTNFDFEFCINHVFLMFIRLISSV